MAIVNRFSDLAKRAIRNMAKFVPAKLKAKFVQAKQKPQNESGLGKGVFTNFVTGECSTKSRALRELDKAFVETRKRLNADYEGFVQWHANQKEYHSLRALSARLAKAPFLNADEIKIAIRFRKIVFFERDFYKRRLNGAIETRNALLQMETVARVQKQRLPEEFEETVKTMDAIIYGAEQRLAQLTAELNLATKLTVSLG